MTNCARLAAEIAQESPGRPFRLPRMVHEVYLRLVDVEKAQHWNHRGHFFAAAAEAMRRILVENARRKRALKAGGRLRRVEILDIEVATEGRSLDLLAFDQALEKLAAKAPRKAELVELRFFGGLTTSRLPRRLASPPQLPMKTGCTPSPGSASKWLARPPIKSRAGILQGNSDFAG